MSQDPIRDGLNWYTYAGANPLMFIDPSGLSYQLYQQNIYFNTTSSLRSNLTWNAKTGSATLEVWRLDHKGNIVDSVKGTFQNGRNGAFIDPKDNRMYISNDSYWSTFGRVVDPPVVVNTKRDTVAMASAIVITVKAPAIAAAVKKSVAPLTAMAASVNDVYISKAIDGTTQYVGITNDLSRRAAEHLSTKGIDIVSLMPNLSRSDARAVEQVLIEIYGLSKNGGTLINQINSIAQSNPIYAEALKRGYELLESIGYK